MKHHNILGGNISRNENVKNRRVWNTSTVYFYEYTFI